MDKTKVHNTHVSILQRGHLNNQHLTFFVPVIRVYGIFTLKSTDLVLLIYIMKLHSKVTKKHEQKKGRVHGSIVLTVTDQL